MRKNKEGFSIISALVIMGFLLVLTSSVFNLVLRELNDNRGLGNYTKAFAGAESAQELALLSIKDEEKGGYTYYDKIDFDVNNRSVVLSDNPLDKNMFSKSKDIFIHFDLDTKTSSYSGNLKSLDYDIVPLFFQDQLNPSEEKLTDITFNITAGDSSKVSWNILGADSGIVGIGEFNKDSLGKNKIIDSSSDFSLSDISVNDFLSNSDTNYLILFNSGTSDISYNLSSPGVFIKPETIIISSAKIGDYRQNISTSLDNTEYLDFLKYSIFSN